VGRSRAHVAHSTGGYPRATFRNSGRQKLEQRVQPVNFARVMPRWRGCSVMTRGATVKRRSSISPRSDFSAATPTRFSPTDSTT